MPFPQARELLRATLGGLFGIGACALLIHVFASFGLMRLFLVAPLGASAVLVFAVPNSPLAQPWSAVVGNTVSALCGLLALGFAGPQAAPLAAVAIAFAAMMLCRALHPPGGAVALFVGLSPQLAVEAGAAAIVVNVAVMTLALVGAGVVYHRFSGRKYPFRTGFEQEAPVLPQRLGLDKRELDDLLAAFRQTANLGAIDLARLLSAAEDEAVHHRFDGRTCGEAATDSGARLTRNAGLEDIVRTFRQSDAPVLAVVDASGMLMGLLHQRQAFEALGDLARSRWPVRKVRAGDIMQRPERVLEREMPLGEAVVLLLRGKQDFLPVAEKGRFMGLLSRAALLDVVLLVDRDRTAA